MKNLKFFLAITLALVCFNSCSSDDDEVTYTYLNEFINTNLVSYRIGNDDMRHLIRNENHRIIEVYSNGTTTISYNGQNIYTKSHGAIEHLELDTSGSVIKQGNEGHSVYRKYYYDGTKMIKMESYSLNEVDATIDIEYVGLYEIHITFTDKNYTKEETIVLDPDLNNEGCVVDVLGLSSVIRGQSYGLYNPNYIYYLGGFGYGIHNLPKGSTVAYDDAHRITQLKYGNQSRIYEYN